MSSGTLPREPVLPPPGLVLARNKESLPEVATAAAWPTRPEGVPARPGRGCLPTAGGVCPSPSHVALTRHRNNSPAFPANASSPDGDFGSPRPGRHPARHNGAGQGGRPHASRGRGAQGSPSRGPSLAPMGQHSVADGAPPPPRPRAAHHSPALRRGRCPVHRRHRPGPQPGRKTLRPRTGTRSGVGT